MEKPLTIAEWSAGLHKLLQAGWITMPTSCACGGSYAWLVSVIPGRVSTLSIH
jgi:hypothetical protein